MSQRQEKPTNADASVQETIQELVAQEIIQGMVAVPAGTFIMGDDNGEWWGEKPAHQVALSAFSIGRFPVTQSQWVAVMGSNPSRFFQGPDAGRRPVDSVSWDDAQQFIEKLNG